MGKQAFVPLVQEFTKMTNAGADFGMSLEDSTERLGEELKKRQMMGALTNMLDSNQRAKVAEQIAKSIRQQQKYSSALGMSTSELVNFTNALVTDTPGLTAALNMLDDEIRNQVIAGVTDFGTAMKGMGGDAGGSIAQAMTEAAAKGAMGFSQEMTDFVTAMPSLKGPLDEYINAFNNGTLTQERGVEIAEKVARKMASAETAERERIRRLSLAGNAYADVMSSGVAQFSQAIKILDDEADGVFDPVQTGTNLFNTIIAQLGGSFRALQNSFFEGLSKTENLTETFEEASNIIRDAIENVFPIFRDSIKAGGEEVGSFKGMIITAAEKLAEWITQIPVIVETLRNAFNTVKNFITEQIPVIVETLRNAFNTVKNFITELFDPLSNTRIKLANLIDGFVTTGTILGEVVLALTAIKVSLGALNLAKALTTAVSSAGDFVGPKKPGMFSKAWQAAKGVAGVAGRGALAAGTALGGSSLAVGGALGVGGALALNKFFPENVLKQAGEGIAEAMFNFSGQGKLAQTELYRNPTLSPETIAAVRQRQASAQVDTNAMTKPSSVPSTEPGTTAVNIAGKSLEELVGELIAAQNSTNKLLKTGNTITKEVSDRLE